MGSWDISLPSTGGNPSEGLIMEFSVCMEVPKERNLHTVESGLNQAEIQLKASPVIVADIWRGARGSWCWTKSGLQPLNRAFGRMFGQRMAAQVIL